MGRARDGGSAPGIACGSSRWNEGGRGGSEVSSHHKAFARTVCSSLYRRDLEATSGLKWLR